MERVRRPSHPLAINSGRSGEVPLVFRGMGGRTYRHLASEDKPHKGKIRDILKKIWSGENLGERPQPDITFEQHNKAMELLPSEEEDPTGGQYFAVYDNKNRKSKISRDSIERTKGKQKPSPGRKRRKSDKPVPPIQDPFKTPETDWEKAEERGYYGFT